MFIIRHKKIFLTISAVLVLASLALILSLGLKIGIDFKGGALAEVVYVEMRPAQSELEPALANLGFGSILLQPTGDLGYILKTRDLTETEHTSLIETLSLEGKYVLEERSFNSVGPSVGRELTRKAVIAVVLVSLGIITFIAFAFRKVSKPVSSWKYGLIAIVTLLHDVIIPVGIFTLLSRFYGAEVDTLFVVAVLTILGLSVSDTIVIFDRIRENIKEQENVVKASSKLDFSETVGKSLEQSFTRSLSTSLTVILVLLTLYFLGPVSTKYFALMLTAGMFLGTYSSLFLASPLLVLVENWQRRRQKN